MAELLLELFSEEIPARMQPRAAEDLRRLVCEALTAAGLPHGTASAFATPRRLVLVVADLPGRQPDTREERRGPRVGSPAKAVDGFLRAAGLDSVDQCEQREAGKAVHYFAVIERPGRATAAVVAGIVADVVARFPWPKSMRWRNGRVRWVRPLHRVVCLLDGAIVPGAIDLGNGDTVAFGDETEGHRFLAPGALRVAGAADHREKLRAAKVILDPAERATRIREGAARLAAAEGLTVQPDPALVEECAGLVEWPVPLIGGFADAFLTVPPEAIVAAMRGHQKYFALRRADGSLAPRFVVIANMETPDGGRTVAAGNERVLAARLSDAKFFWNQDRAVPLPERLAALKPIVFHARLGTMHDKAERVASLARVLAGSIPGAVPDLAERAGRLAKADLTTGMVGEFPELQGVMGRYYALAGQEEPAVAEALADHYRPQGPSDACPAAPVSVAVALADKLDLLAGFFAIGERPTGSRDPYALRRAALGVIRLVREGGVVLPLTPAVDAALALYRATLAGERGPEAGDGASFEVATDTIPVLLGFVRERLKVLLRDEGVPHDRLEAAFALATEDDLHRLLQRVEALQAFLDSEDGRNLVVAYRRAANIVRIEARKDGKTFGAAVRREILEMPQETALADALTAAGDAIDPCLGRGDYVGAMQALSRLREPVDSFFDHVTVNTDSPELRENRLNLLALIADTMNRVADFSRIEG